MLDGLLFRSSTTLQLARRSVHLSGDGVFADYGDEVVRSQDYRELSALGSDGLTKRPGLFFEDWATNRNNQAPDVEA